MVVHHCHDYIVCSRIVSDTRYLVVAFSDCVLVFPGCRVFDLSELRQQVVLGRGRYSTLAFRHRRTVHSCQVEGKAFRLAPVVDRLRRLQLDLALSTVAVRDRQAVRSVILRCRGQRAVMVVHHCHDYIVRGRIVRDTRYLVVALRDCVLVLAGLRVIDRAKHGFQIRLGSGCFCVRRHRRIAHGSQVEGEALRLAPVVDRLRRLQFDSALSTVLVRNRQAVRSVILRRCGQRAVMVVHHCHDYIVRGRIVRDTRHSVIALSDCVLVHASCRVFDLAKHGFQVVLGRGRFRVRRHRRVFGHGCQVEGEAFRLAPVVD